MKLTKKEQIFIRSNLKQPLGGIGKLLRAVRKHQELTKEALSDKCFCTVEDITRLEKGDPDVGVGVLFLYVLAGLNYQLQFTPKKTSTPAEVEDLDPSNKEDIELAEKRIKDVRAGRAETIPLSKVAEQYGLDVSQLTKKRRQRAPKK